MRNASTSTNKAYSLNDAQRQTVSPREASLVAALRAGVITWFEFFEKWRDASPELEEQEVDERKAA